MVVSRMGGARTVGTAPAARNARNVGGVRTGDDSSGAPRGGRGRCARRRMRRPRHDPEPRGGAARVSRALRFGLRRLRHRAARPVRAARFSGLHPDPGRRGCLSARPVAHAAHAIHRRLSLCLGRARGQRGDQFLRASAGRPRSCVPARPCHLSAPEPPDVGDHLSPGGPGVLPCRLYRGARQRPGHEGRAGRGRGRRARPAHRSAARARAAQGAHGDLCVEPAGSRRGMGERPSRRPCCDRGDRRRARDRGAPPPHGGRGPGPGNARQALSRGSAAAARARGRRTGARAVRDRPRDRLRAAPRHRVASARLAAAVRHRGVLQSWPGALDRRCARGLPRGHGGVGRRGRLAHLVRHPRRPHGAADRWARPAESERVSLVRGVAGAVPRRDAVDLVDRLHRIGGACLCVLPVSALGHSPVGPASRDRSDRSRGGLVARAVVAAGARGGAFTRA